MSENGPLVDPDDVPEWMRTLVKRTADLDPGHFGWPNHPPPSSARPAAVLILLGEGEQGPEVLLLRPGQVTRPVPISGGLAIIKLASVNQVRPEPVDAADPAVREELRQRLFGERMQSFGQGYLQELLGDAIIIER